MGKLETLRDVMAIIRDFLLIIVLFGLIVGIVLLGMLLMGLINTIQTQGLSGILPLVGGMAAGSLGNSGSSSSYAQGKYTMDSETQQIFTELSDAMNSQDVVALSTKLDELEKHFTGKGMTDAADLTKKVKTSMMTGDIAGAQEYGTQLFSLFKQQ